MTTAKEWLNKAENAANKKEWNIAVTCFLKAGDLFLLENDTYNYADCYSAAGFYAYAIKQYAKALNYFQISTKVWDEIDNVSNLIEDYINAGACCKAQFNFKGAINFYQKVIDLNENKKNVTKITPIQLMVTFNNIADVLIEKGDYEQATHWLQKALQNMQGVREENPDSLSHLYANLGNCYYYLGDYDEALNYQLAALRLRKQLPNDNAQKKYLLASIYTNIGACYQNKCDFKIALSFFEKITEILDETQQTDVLLLAQSQNNQGTSHEKLKAYDTALRCYKKAIEWAEKNQLPLSEMARFYHNLARCLREQQRYDEAVKYHQKALSLSEKSLGKYHPDVAHRYNEMALTYQQNKQKNTDVLRLYQKALKCLNPTFVNKNVLDNPILNLSLCSVRGLETLNGKARVLQQIIAYQEEGGDNRYRMAVNQTYQMADTVINKMRQGYATEGAKFMLAEKAQEVYEGAINNLYATTMSHQSLEQAFEYAEKNKALVLLTSIKDKFAQKMAGIPAKELDEIKKMTVDLRFFEQQLRKTAYQNFDEAMLEAWQQQYFDLKQRYEKLVLSWHQKYPKYYHLSYNTITEKTLAVQQQLQQHEALVSFFVGDNELFVFVLTNENIHCKRINKPNKLKAMVNTFIACAYDVCTEDFIDISSELFDLLILPIYSLIQHKKRLLVLPDADLYALPFEALINTQVPNYDALINRAINTDVFTNLPYLLQEFDVRYHYSASLWLYLKKQAPKTNKQVNSFFGLAPVLFNNKSQQKWKDNNQKHLFYQANKGANEWKSITKYSTPSDLLSTANEVKSIYEQFVAHNHEARALFFDEASKPMLKKYIGAYKYVLLSTHGVFNRQNADLSYMCLYKDAEKEDKIDDSRLYLSEAYGLQLQADLVVLSSCESGKGKLLQGEGMMGLNRGFLYAGSRNIVYALIKVPEKSSSQLTQYLFKTILTGEVDYSKALRAAKQQLVAENKIPAEWMGFVLIGT